MTTTPKYHSVTAHINKDGSVSVIAWRKEGRRLTFDTIPLHASGGEVGRVTAYETKPA